MASGDPLLHYPESVSVHVQLETADGQVHYLFPGDIIGRMAGAAVVIADPRVSEAHAMVSLRGGALHLLTLRGRFAVDGRTPSSVELVVGQRIELARDLAVKVVGIHLPEEVLALQLGDEVPMPLAGVTSVVRVGPRTMLVQRYEADALAVIWSQDGRWWWRASGGEPALLDDAGFEAHGVEVRCTQVRVGKLDNRATRQLGGVAAPLRICCHFDTVQLHREGQPPVSVSGIGARIISELVSYGTPVEWHTLATVIWGERAPHRLRRNLDQALLRLRKKLEAARIRPDLVRTDGGGKLELQLRDGDEVEDLG